ncbi:hypothetical protein SDC9_211672 [bioreactor metagenome]|uniref:Uncharacterized protein n=1 Tax=bioreactor metagenome TaxID=1076179 RepID=A0A645JJR6_9ZZZZ
MCKGNMADLPAPPIKISAIAQLNTEIPINETPAVEAKTLASPEVSTPKPNVFV